MIIGIDEVGRGCWAGPLLVVAAYAKSELIPGLKDSKQLSKKQRETFAPAIKESCVLGEGWVTPVEIDQVGLTAAMKLGVERALLALQVPYDTQIIMDGSINYCEPCYTNVECVIKADDLHPIVSAASIYAKVKRDLYMQELSLQYPGYGFEKHVGYGTKMHSEALETQGVTSAHRRSYKPVQRYA